MNHIYKSIFNKALGVFTAVPEFASAHGKGSERTVVGRVAKGTAGFAASALAISVGLALTSTSAVAAPGIFINNEVDGTCLSVNDTSDPYLALQRLRNASVVTTTPGIATSSTAQLFPLGTFEATTRNPCLSAGTAAEARDTQTNRVLFYGSDKTSGTVNLTIGGRLDVNSGIIGVGDRGTNGTDATNSIRMGTGTTLDDANKQWNAISIGTDAGVNTASSVAIGYNAKAGQADKFQGQGAVALGYNAQALGTSAISIGEDSSATNGHNGVAIGAYSKTSNEKAISIGAFNTASGAQSIVMAGNYDTNSRGPVSVASGTRATVIGAETTVSGNNSLAIGDTNTVASARTYAIGNNINVAAGANDSLVFGTKAAVGGPEAIALGNTANSKTEGAISIGARTVSGDGDLVPGVADIGNKSISIGYESVANRYDTIAMGVQASTQAADSGVAPWDAVAIGSKAKATTYKALAIGAYSQATGRQSTVIGNDIQGQNSTASGTRSQILGVQSNVSGDNSVSIGDTNTVASARTYALGNNINAAAGTDDSLAFGTSAAVESANTIAMGNTAKAHTENSISIGKNSESGKVDKFDGKQSVAIGFEAKSMGTSTIAMGSYATSENGHDGVAIGTYAKTGNEKAITIGAYSSASGAQSIVIANNYNSDNSNNSNKSTATGRRAIVMGAESHATAEQALAIGDKNTVASARTYAIGNNINVAAGADDSLVFGTRAAVGAANSVAIGANANAAQANSVALGAGSTTANVHTGDYTLSSAYSAAGQSVDADGTVSVGSRLRERQIQNVAAGVISSSSTDAINGSQLYATNFYLTNIAGDVKTTLGGNAALGNDGHLTMTNIGGTGENTVDDAIKNLKTAIDNKADTTASVTSENPADIKVDKEAPVGNTTNYKLSLGNDAKAKLAKAATALQTVEGDSNITATKDATDPTKVKLALNKNLTADSLTLGNTAGDHAVVNKDGLTIANGPSVKKEGINAGDKVISGVADGNIAAGSKEAVNGGQLAEVKSKADSAVQNVVSANPTALTATKAGDTVTLTPNFIAGDLVNPATGAVNTPAAGDAGKLVTAGTIANALANTHFVVDTAKTDGELDAASKHDQKIKSGNKVTLQAGKNLKAKQTNAADGATVEFSLKDSISLTQVTAGTGANQVVLGNDGVKVGGNTYINNDGLNANSKVISNVAAGVKPTDAVNKGQLDAVKNVADSAVQSVDVAANENNLVVDNNDPKNPKLRLRKAVDLDSIKLENNVGEKSFLNSAGLTIEGGPAVTRSGINANNTKVTNVTDGDVNSTSKDAVNGSQLYNVASNVKDLIGPDAAIDPATGKVTVADPTKGIGETGKGTIGEAIKAVKDAADKAAAEHTTVKAGNNIVVTEGTNAAGGKEYTVKTADNLDVTSVKAGDTTVNNDGLTIAGGPSVKKDGINAGDKNITNVADGNVAAGSKDAVNGGQLYDVAKNVADLVGPDATIDPATGKVTVADPTKGIGETGKGTIGDAIKAVNDLAKKAAAEKTSVKAKDGRSNVTVTEGTNAAGGHEYTVDVERSVTNAGSDYVTVTNNHDADSNTTTYTVDVSDKTKASLAKADSAVQGLTSKDGNLNFTKGANGNVEVSFNDNLNVKNVTTDRVQVVNGPSMTKDGINAADKAISNVANGNVAKGSKDAVNGGQLHETAQSVADVIGGGATVKDGKVVAGQNGIGNTGQNTVHGAIAAINQNTANNFNQIRGDLRKMDRDLRGGIAGALATAGLPQAFRPGKSMVAAAASTYRGQSGLAIGVSRISDNGKVILKVTGNTNSRGDFGGTIGAGYQW